MATTAHRRVLAAAASIALLAGAAACGGDAEDTSPKATGEASGPEVTELAVGIVPVVDHAAVFVAQQQGFFEDEGLTVETRAVQGGAAAVPAMMSGDLQSAFATYPSYFLARSQGLELTIVAEGVRATEDTGAVYVAADSPIQGPEDLAGATIAVNTLNNTGDVTIKAVLAEQGIDPDSVKFLELPFPEMGGALEQGHVDAAWLVEPFRSGVIANGGRKVLASYSGVADGIPVSGLAMSSAFVKQNPNTVAAFARAIERANAYLAEDPDRSREVLLTYSQTSPEVAQAMELPLWVEGAPDLAELERWNDLLVDTGVLDEPVDVASMLFQQP